MTTGGIIDDAAGQRAAFDKAAHQPRSGEEEEEEEEGNRRCGTTAAASRQSFSSPCFGLSGVKKTPSNKPMCTMLLKNPTYPPTVLAKRGGFGPPCSPPSCSSDHPEPGGMAQPGPPTHATVLGAPPAAPTARPPVQPRRGDEHRRAGVSSVLRGDGTTVVLARMGVGGARVVPSFFSWWSGPPWLGYGGVFGPVVRAFPPSFSQPKSRRPCHPGAGGRAGKLLGACGSKAGSVGGLLCVLLFLALLSPLSRR